MGRHEGVSRERNAIDQPGAVGAASSDLERDWLDMGQLRDGFRPEREDSHGNRQRYDLRNRRGCLGFAVSESVYPDHADPDHLDHSHGHHISRCWWRGVGHQPTADHRLIHEA